MQKTKSGNVFSHVLSAVFVRDGRARSDRLDIKGPECSPGGGTRGRMVCASAGCERDIGEVVKARKGLSCCCGRGNGCRFDMNDAERCEDGMREEMSSRLRDFIVSP